MEPLAENLQQPDEFRPAKRVRLDAPLHVTEDVQEEIVDDGEDWNDIYGAAAEDAQPQNERNVLYGSDTNVLSSGVRPLPKLDDVSQDVVPGPDTLEQAPNGTLDLAPVGEHAADSNEPIENEDAPHKDNGVPDETLDHRDDLIDEQHHDVSSAEEAVVRMVEDVSAVNDDENPILDGLESAVNRDETSMQPGLTQHNASINSQGLDMVNHDSKPPIKATEDIEFMEAAAAQRESKTAEWQFDSSDAESSSDSDSDSETDSDDSDDDSDGGYEMLDPATAARMLMQGDGDDDDGDRGKKSNGDRQPRTANEIKETIIPKPDVTITEDMKITELGSVERTVENMVLIKGSTPGEYQVLESGSVLCNEKRDVVGAVLETFGRVQAPMYSVQLTNAHEIEQAGLIHGAKVYYVDSHSTFVFTQPLKNLKGTDASNIHDEEVGAEEMEFSDDEAEAEYKRQKKQAKKVGRGGMNTQAARGGPRNFDVSGQRPEMSYMHGSDAPRQNYGGGMSYDEEPSEDFYSPLKRPDNLGEMMAGNGPQTHRSQPGNPDHSRGRGRGDRGRGRGDQGRGWAERGRGRGGSEKARGGDRGRGRGSTTYQHSNDRGRGGAHPAKQNSHKGNAQSFPDRHNDESKSATIQHALPPKPELPQQSPASVQQYSQPYQYQQPAPSTYQFNGYTFQHGAQAVQQPHLTTYYSQQHSPATAAALPPCAYVSPSQYQAQQASQSSPWAIQHGEYATQQGQQQMTLAYPALNGQQTYVQGASGRYDDSAPSQQQHQPNNLADVLRRLGGQLHRPEPLDDLAREHKRTDKFLIATCHKTTLGKHKRTYAYFPIQSMLWPYRADGIANKIIPSQDNIDALGAELLYASDLSFLRDADCYVENQLDGDTIRAIPTTKLISP
nr:h/aca ribonucleoprotein complex non-core subunit naf1 [Quercus suber]